MGATEENHNVCKKCPIEKACQYPFEKGFHTDPKRSLWYFQDMLGFLLSNVLEYKVTGGALVVGGTWGKQGVRKESGVAQRIAEHLGADLINGGPVGMLPLIDTVRYGLVVWMPNVSNEEEKFYPKKRIGGVLVCSKVMREGVTHADAAKRIFAMKGNAVIEITPKEHTVDGKFDFRFADALSNTMHSGPSLDTLAFEIAHFTKWSNQQKRVRSVSLPLKPEIKRGHFTPLLNLVKMLSEKVEVGLGQRYFGNVSTRCVKLFPSRLTDGDWTGAWVSRRNIDKRFIEPTDMVWVTQPGPDEDIFYYGGDSRKPSVDAAIQLTLYRENPKLRFMVHGHASIADSPETSVYYPCGDLREVEEVSELLKKGHRIINLRNHGFLIAAEDLEELEKLVKGVEIINRL
jgi:ribulose-5-phosphate 4-epimerase/fuculose-1-phosphate aldolase